MGRTVAPLVAPPRSLAARSRVALAAMLLPLVLGACAGVRYPSGEPLVYPTPPTSDQVDDYHGTKVPDPYRVLEDPDAPETRAWVEAQNKVTFAFLDKVPERAALRDRIRALWNHERFGVPVRRGGRMFYTRNDGLSNQAVLYVADADGSNPRSLLDPNTLSSEGTVALTDWVPSRDGRLVAWAASRGGSDWREWRVRDVATGTDLDDHLRWSKFSGAAWLPDGSGFFYGLYDAPAEGATLTGTNYDQRLCLHRLGTPQSADEVILKRPDHREWGFDAQVSEDGRWLVVGVWRGSEPRNLLWARPLDAPAGTPFLEPAPEFTCAVEFLGNVGDTFYLLTDRDAPRRRIVAVDVRSSGGEWRTVVPESDANLVSAALCGGRIVASYLRDARSELRLFHMDGTDGPAVALPGTGSVDGLRGAPDDGEAFFGFTGFTRPYTVFRLHVDDGRTDTFRAPAMPFDADAFTVTQEFCTSPDGTRVPLFICRRTDVVPDGDRPTLLYAYGGFNIPVTPAFSVQNLAWMERGGVFVVANIRGGGEYGAHWHRAALRENRPRAFEDFEAAARHLVSSGWTRPARLAIAGGSNGGLLVGACMTRHPELFGAAIPAVGVLDMLRYHRFTIGWAWVPEYGSADEPADFPFLFAYSPLHNLHAGTRYPATLITTGDHDDRVVPAHSLKFGAALQAAHAGDRPVLLRVEIRAGHGLGKPTEKRIEEAADVLAFLTEVLR